MNLVTRFEHFVERLMERTFTRATGSHLQPVEIGKRLVRAMESDQSVGMEGVLVPNVYDVFLSSVDYEQFKEARASLAKNLESHLGRVARQRQFHMMSRPLVNLCMNDRLRAGDVVVEAHLQDVDRSSATSAQHTTILPPVESLLSVRPSAPSLLCNGESHAVLRSPTRVGRLPDNDIVLNDKRVSRHHAEVVERGGHWILRDTGSTNGTAVNGKVVKESALKQGDTVSLGGLEVTWEQ